MTDQETAGKKIETAATTETPKKKQSSLSGYWMIGLAFLLFWVGGQFRAPMELESRMLIATAGIDERFEESVVLILKHNLGGAYGVVVNAPVSEGNEGFAHGGPVEPEKEFALYTYEIDLEEGVMLGTTGLSYIEGADGIATLEALEKQPRWSRKYKGYAGWSAKQLDREVRKGGWRIIKYDEKLMQRTPQADIWDAANKLADKAAEKKKPKAEKKEKPPESKI